MKQQRSYGVLAFITGIVSACLLLDPGIADAALVTNPGLSITHRVTVQPVIVSNDNGSETSTFMGSMSDELAIKSQVDVIWGQAGIDVDWFVPNSWNDTFANLGNGPFDQDRPVGDLTTIVNNGLVEGVGSPDPHTLSMYFVQIVPGIMQVSSTQIRGRSQLDAAGSTMFIGSSLPGFDFEGDPIGNDLIAKVIAHEIGHSLGLEHISDPPNDPQNLMLKEDDSLQPINALLNLDQVAAARMSQFAVAVPEPGMMMFCIVGFGVCAWRHRRVVKKTAMQ